MWARLHTFTLRCPQGCAQRGCRGLPPARYRSPSVPGGTIGAPPGVTSEISAGAPYSSINAAAQTRRRAQPRRSRPIYGYSPLRPYNLPCETRRGGMAERTNALVLKTRGRKTPEGSNPSTPAPAQCAANVKFVKNC